MQLRGRGGGIVTFQGLAAVAGEPLELLQIECAARDPEHVAGAAGLDRVLSERLPEPRDVALDEVRGRARRGVSPQAVDEPQRRYDGVRLAEEEC